MKKKNECTNRIKIVFFINTLFGGGTEKVLVHLVNQIDTSKYDISIKCLLGGGQNEMEINDSIHFSSVIRSKNDYLRKCYARFFYKIMPPFLFHRLFIGNHYDIEVAYDSGYPTRIIWASNNQHSKKICFLHGDIQHDPKYLKVYGSRANAIKKYRSMNKVCFVSRKNQETYFREYGDTENTMVVHNVMDVDKIIRDSQEGASTGYDKNKINIVTIGRLVPVKGYGRLLEAIKNIGPIGDSYSVTIIGCGEKREEYLQYIKKNGLTWVRILDYQQNPFPYVKNADLFICSSFHEGYSTAVCEAALLGTPVITTACAGMEEIFFDKKGGRIVDNSEKGIQDELDKYLHNQSYRDTLKQESTAKKGCFRNEVKNRIYEYERLFEQCLGED